MKFDTPLQEFVYTRTYSKWLPQSKRRETFDETVSRYIDFLRHMRGDRIPEKVLRKAEEYLLSLDDMPSMRLLWSAGPAAERCNVCAFNCAYASVDNPRAFAETLYILMNGTGQGFSVENRHVSKLPVVPGFTGSGAGEYVIEDSKEGWADSVYALMSSLWSGRDLSMVYKAIRPEGSRLITFGGRASGPAPLLTLHNFIRETFSKAQGRHLTPKENHDLKCQVAEIVVVGGVRRSSLISLSDLDDPQMAAAKEWPFPPRRSMANNSAVYREKPSASRFLSEWAHLANSGTGERGIFNLAGARATSPARRKAGTIQGTNPCGEILLRSKGFCNVTSVVARADDDLDDLLQKVETATWLGAIQSTFTDFQYLSRGWKKNCDEERLLGVSITGMYDNYLLLSDPTILTAMKQKALKVAAHAAKKLGVPMSAAVTCVKPEGTGSLVVNSSSGAHPRHSPYYKRRFRISATDPLFKMLRDQGLKFVPEVGQRDKDWGQNDNCTIYEPGRRWSSSKVRTWVCEFPVKSPDGAVCRSDVSALDHLGHYLRTKRHWCEHNPSITISVRPEEWFSVGEAVYKNWDDINGVSFLPYDGGHYDLAPYEEVTREEYLKQTASFPKLDYSQLSKYETEGSEEDPGNFACTGGQCEL